MNKSTTDWEVRSLASLGTYLNGFAFKPQHWGDHGLPIVRIRELLDQTVEPDRYDGPLAQAFKIQDGDLIFSWSATLAALFWNRGPAYLNQHLFKVTASNDVDLRFLHQLINFNLNSLAARSHGTTMKHVTRGDLADYVVRLPELPEQRRIAAVLDTLDDQIRSAEQIVTKLTHAKHGLLEDLLDPAIHRGVLSTVGEEFEVRSGITLGPHRRPTNGSSGYLRVANVQRSVIRLDEISRLQATIGEVRDYELRSGDLLVVEGHADVGQIGRCARVLEDAEGLLYQNHLFRLRSSSMDPVFAECWLNSEFAKAYWRATCSTSSGLNTINSRQLRSMSIAVPPPSEQRRIGTISLSAQASIDGESRVLDNLKLLKQGLRSDLLTGRVRVPAEATS